MTEDVIVIGGGLAGLAAAVALAERGVPVTLLESRPRLGGRASSFVDQATGMAIDNCQHVSMGCCTNFRHFCETVGVADLLRTEQTLYFIGADRKINPFSASRLPAPLHLFPAFRRLSYLSRSDLRELSRGLKALAKIPSTPTNKTPVTQPFDRWLAEHGQSPNVIENFWLVVLVSALSETLDRIDTFHARKVFFDGFLAHRKGWEVQIPTVPLEELYGPPLQNWLAEHGVQVRLKTGVEQLETGSGPRFPSPLARRRNALREAVCVGGAALSGVGACCRNLLLEIPSLRAWRNWNPRRFPACICGSIGRSPNFRTRC